MTQSTRLTDYIERVTRGEGFMPWQDRSAESVDEQEFRAEIEERKYALLGAGVRDQRPALTTDEHIERVQRNIRDAEWARTWFENKKTLADAVIEGGPEWIDAMIPELTPTARYSFVCPACFGVKSHEGSSESNIIMWDWREPDVITCRRCGQRYPDPAYPETARLVMPRRDQTLTFYLNDAERANPDDRSGKHAYRWARHPIHPSFEGIIREYKISFAAGLPETLALVYRITNEREYARAGVAVLNRFTECFSQWLYHDYWETYTDCDPLWAAWHYLSLPIEWKRHLTTTAYERDTIERAAMLQNYWGAGRVHPSTGGMSHLDSICVGHDMLSAASNEDNSPLWPVEQQSRVERDLILEWTMEAEPYLGGHGKAERTDNKSPRIYATMAIVARCLGIPEYADVALRGYEGVRDESFGFDGFSHESPAYNDMYLSALLDVPERLHGFRHHDGTVIDLFATDAKLGLMVRGMIDTLRSDSRLAPLSDTREVRDPAEYGASARLEIAMKRYPERYSDTVRAIYQLRQTTPSAYAVRELDARLFDEPVPLDLKLPEQYYPAWMTAILRHGEGPRASMLALSANPPGGHRHEDNLGLYYVDRGDTILGDLGYLSAAPIQRWIAGTLSHNLVVVDDEHQRHGGDAPRQPRFHRMMSTPQMSVVEASSECYPQCREYRRTVALAKGPNEATFTLDIFRVKGGQKHTWRAFSEIAASDTPEGSLSFADIDMPPEQPIPDYGASEAPEHIAGLRDVRCSGSPPPSWRAVWSDAQRPYRLWMLSPVHRVQAGHGPGQETWEEAGRRVRYVEAIREGADVESVFVAVHDPAGVVTRAEVIETIPHADPNAVVVRIASEWGTYLFFSDCADEVETDRTRFAGAFGTLCIPLTGPRWCLTSAARTLMTVDGFGFDGGTTVCESVARREGHDRIALETAIPREQHALPDDVTQYVAIETNTLATGLPVARVDGRTITVGTFPVPDDIRRVQYETVRCLRE